MKRLLLILASLLIASPLAAAPIGGEAGVAYTNAYTFRGVPASGPALQPSLDLMLGGLSAALWASHPVGSRRSEATNEVDATVAFAPKTALLGFDLTTGLTAYHYPSSTSTSTTWEPFIGASKGIGRAMTVSTHVYRDLTLHTTTAQAMVSYLWAAPHCVTITPRATVGRVFGGGGSAYTYWESAIEISRALRGAVTLTLTPAYVSSSDRTIKRDNWVYTLGIKAAF